MASDKILSSKRDGIGSLVFNHPEKRNALSPDMALAAAEVIEDFARDPAEGAPVLHGPPAPAEADRQPAGRP